ncbi:hypothetical protein EVAR_66550_1 [Eumeta japonica]|uniref:Uncharacterized protein n=1 Tax=Eumeta variegata TaxID=151549 RepID=A0A4C1ZHI8_EUMVA|nr:hypothetical protein EVAR_66550_1 [Eumeta japonica]
MSMPVVTDSRTLMFSLEVSFQTFLGGSSWGLAVILMYEIFAETACVGARCGAAGVDGIFFITILLLFEIIFLLGVAVAVAGAEAVAGRVTREAEVGALSFLPDRRMKPGPYVTNSRGWRDFRFGTWVNPSSSKSFRSLESSLQESELYSSDKRDSEGRLVGYLLDLHFEVGSRPRECLAVARRSCSAPRWIPRRNERGAEHKIFLFLPMRRAKTHYGLTVRPDARCIQLSRTKNPLKHYGACH